VGGVVLVLETGIAAAGTSTSSSGTAIASLMANCWRAWSGPKLCQSEEPVPAAEQADAALRRGPASAGSISHTAIAECATIRPSPWRPRRLRG